MAFNSENWKDYPYLVEWVDQMNAWAEKYQIYEFIQADNSGEDPSGRIRRFRSPEFKNTLDGEFVWSVVDGGGVAYVQSGDVWHSDTVGWYVGRVSHGNEPLAYDVGKLACIKCQGESFYVDPEGEEVDCDLCEAGETSVWFDLTDTDFRLPR